MKKIFILAFCSTFISCQKPKDICVPNPPIDNHSNLNPYFKVVTTTWPNQKITTPGNYLVMQFLARMNDLPGCIITDGTLRLNGNLSGVKDVTIVVHNQGGVLFNQKLSDVAVNAVGFKPKLAIMPSSLDTISVWVKIPMISQVSVLTGTIELGFIWQGSSSYTLSSGVTMGQKIFF